MKYFFAHFAGMINFAVGKSCTTSSRELPQVRKEARVSGRSGVIWVLTHFLFSQTYVCL